MIGYYTTECASGNGYTLTYEGNPSAPYEYGADADGRRGEMRQDDPEEATFVECDPEPAPEDAAEVRHFADNPPMDLIDWEWEE